MWARSLREATDAPERPTDAVASVLLKGQTDWRKRLQDEPCMVETLAKAVLADAAVRCEGSRTTRRRAGSAVARPDDDVLPITRPTKLSAAASRHAVSGHGYAELDLRSAHPSAAWGACVLLYGDEGYTVVQAKSEGCETTASL